MRKFGLIGFPLTHSFSKKYFTEKFETQQILDCKYDLYSIADAREMVDLIEREPKLCGLNVTIPHKLDVISFLDEIDSSAKEIGAVNCIAINQKEGAAFLRGYNTDVYGFEESLKPLLQVQHQKALIFGNGGAAKAVKYVLKKLNIPLKKPLQTVLSLENNCHLLPEKNVMKPNKNFLLLSYNYFRFLFRSK